MRRRLQPSSRGIGPSDSYVADGLVHMWDAASHDDDSWTDTVGGLRLSIEGARYNWGDDFIHVNGADIPYTYLYTPYFSGSGFDGHTIQVVARWYRTAADQWGRFISLRSGVNDPCEILIDKAATSGVGRLRFEYFDGAKLADADVEGADMTKPFTATSVLNPSTSSWYGYFNGVKSSVVDGVDYTGPYPSNIVVGSNELGYTNCGVDADFFSVRIYSRALSDDEIMRNNRVDAARFGIGGGA